MIHHCPHCKDTFMEERYFHSHMTVKHVDDHDWINDTMFDDGTVVMLTNDKHPFGKEMRQNCKVCGIVRYVPHKDEMK